MYLFAISYGSYALDQRSVMVDSVDDLMSSSSIRGISMPDFEVLDAKIASASLILTSKEDSVWRNERPRKRTVSFVENRSLTWSTLSSRSLEPTILSRIMPTYLLLLFEMTIFRNSIRNGMNFIINDENPNWWHLGRIVELKNTRVWETQDRIGIVWPGDSSEEEIRTWLSQIENYWWREVSSKVYETGFVAPEMEIMKLTLWSRIRRWNSEDKEFLEIVGNGKTTGSVQKETICVENPKSQRQESQW